MDQSITAGFDAVLNRVKDPESSLPVADLGVVTRFRYNEEKRIIYVFTNYGSHRPACLACVGISTVIEQGINRRLAEELEREFPGYTVEFVPQ